MLHRPVYARVPWLWLCLSAALSLVGMFFVASATADVAGEGWISRETGAQLLWWLFGGIAAAIAMHISPSTWRNLAFPAAIAGLAVMLLMLLLAGTALVPRIKGQANWIVLGGLRLQPVELVKLATLLTCATLAAGPNFDARRLGHCGWVLLVAAIPMAVVAREDLGSALTIPPMVFGILLVAGIKLRWLVLAGLLVATAVVGAYHVLPREGPKAYQWRRIDAFLHPENYALAEAYQTERSKRSIGSGQWLGKGYMQGEQNRLGWVPEKHTDLVFAVIGEEVGFVGSALFAILLLAWCAAGLIAASRAPGPWSRLLCAGFTCLTGGQAAINLCVATGMMPVTGVTLPFVSYGGSSLVVCWLGLGICASSCALEREN
jgi:cell division protein FtsW (lipid II flippase)